MINYDKITNEQGHACVARKEVDYLDILLLLRFISTFTIPSLILSQFLSLLDELLRLTVHGYYFASSPDTLSLILCFYFCLSLHGLT